MMSRSTRAHPEQFINWLFFDSKNHDQLVQEIPVPGNPANLSLARLEWICALKRFFRFRADESTLRLWKPKSPLLVEKISEQTVGVDDVKGIASLCQPTFSVTEVLGASWDSNYVHLLVTADEFIEDMAGEAAKKKDIARELPLEIMHRRFREGRAPLSAPPSEAATSREYAKVQRNSRTAIYDGFHAYGAQAYATIAAPIQIFHPVFQEFLDRVNNPAFEPDRGIVSHVSKLLPTATTIYPSEVEGLREQIGFFRNVLGGPIGQIFSTGTRVPGLRFKVLDGIIIPLVCVEYNRMLGEGGCDPLTQAEFSLREFLISAERKTLLEKCCCPSLLLAGGGAYLSILGVVYTDRLIVQRLTDIKWIGEATTYEDGRVYHLSRVFTSLHLAVEALDKYYDEVWANSTIPAYTPSGPHPRLFPYPTSFNDPRKTTGEGSQSTDFEYTDLFRGDPTNATFLVKAESSDEKLVVKFVDRYGVGAHKLLAEAGMAPKLLYCGSLDGRHDVGTNGSRFQGSTKLGGLYVGPIRMVVMEYIEGESMDKMTCLPSDARDQIQRAINKLHEAQLVFGDLRSPNVMFSGGKAFLIDFDWAGKEGEAHYPRGLSKSVNWPARVEELEMECITRDHDRTMLDRLF